MAHFVKYGGNKQAGHVIGENDVQPNTTNLSKPFLGAAGTDINQIPGGALPSNLAYAQSLAKAVLPDVEREPIDKALLSFLFFSDLAAKSSKPGATVLGAAGEAAMTPASYLLKDRELARKEDLATKTGRATLTASLASSLKPKIGKPSTLMMGPAMGEDNAQKTDTQGNLLFKYNVYNADGTIEDTFEAPRGSGNVTNVKTTEGPEEKLEFEWGKKKQDKLLNFYEGSGTGENAKLGIMANAVQAKDQITKLETIEQLILSDKIQTGAFQSSINEGKKLLNRFGFDFDESKIGASESLQSLSSGMVLQSVSQMKGALSDKELGFLQSMQANIGNTKAGNYLILLSAKYGLQKNLDWQSFFNKFKEENEITMDASPLYMGDTSKEDVKLAAKLKLSWENHLLKDRDSMLEFLEKDAQSFIDNLESQGYNEDEITEEYQKKYTFLDKDNKRIDALEMVQGIFNRTMN